MDLKGLEGLRRVVGALDRGDEIRKFVEFCFCGAPVEGVLPVVSQAFDIRQGGAVVPAGAVEFVGEGDEGRDGFGGR